MIDASHAAEAETPKQQEKPLLADFYARPIYEGNVGVSVFTENTYNATNQNNIGSNTYSKVFLDSNLYFSPQIYVDFDAMVSTSPGIQTNQNYVVDNAQVNVVKLALRYENDDWWVSGGLGSVHYSIAKTFAAGIWGAPLVKNQVAVTNKAGFAGAYNLHMHSLGNHALYGAIFMADNSFLGASYGKSSTPYSLSNGGPSNTGKLNNYAIALDGLNFAALPKLRYHLGSVTQQTESIEVKGVSIPTTYLSPEQRYVAAIIWDKLNISHDFIVSPLFEYNRINNRNGISGFSNNYYTGSALFGYHQWSFGGSYTLWQQDWNTQGIHVSPSANTIPALSFNNNINNQGQVSVGYLFSNGIRIDLGYRNENLQGQSAQAVGLVFKYNLPFSIGM